MELKPWKRGIASEPIELGTDVYFVLGDNRNHEFGQQRSERRRIKARGSDRKSLDSDLSV